MHQAILRGHTARFTVASDMLHDLAAQDSSTQLARRLRRYTTPTLVCVDEVGYLSYDARYADLLFEVITRQQLRACVPSQPSRRAQAHLLVSRMRTFGSRFTGYRRDAQRFGHGFPVSVAKSYAMNRFFGREREVALLDTVYASGNAEFVALYGRRRVGKTFLIREHFRNRQALYCEFTGQKDSTLAVQLAHFTETLETVFYDGKPIPRLTSWSAASRPLPMLCAPR